MILAVNILVILLFAERCSASQSQESRLITIRKTIHKNESIIFNATEIFPGLVDDPWVEEYDPKTGAWEQKSPKDSNFNLSQSFHLLYNYTMEGLDQCTSFMSHDYDTFIGFCSDSTKAFYFRHNPQTKVFDRYLILEVSKGQSITSSSVDYYLMHLYLLVQESQDAFSTHVFQIKDIPVPITNISFGFTNYASSVATIKVDLSSSMDVRRIFVYSTVEPETQIETWETRNIEFMTLLYTKMNQTLEVEGYFNQELPRNPPLNKVFPIKTSFSNKYHSRMSYLSVLPYSFGTWIFSSVVIDGTDQYQLQSCRLLRKEVKKVSCKNCSGHCTILSGGCSSETRQFPVHKATCSFALQNYSMKSSRNIEAHFASDLGAESCEEFSDCAWLEGECKALFSNCRDCESSVTEEPVFECSNITNLSMMCNSLDFETGIEMDQFYKIGSYCANGTSSIYLLTNCQFSKFSFIGDSLNQTLETGSYRFSKNFQSAKAMDKRYSEIYTLMNPYDTGSTYMAVYSEITHTMRIIQSQTHAFEAENYILLMDMQEVNRDYIISYSYNHTSNETYFNVYNYSDQFFSVQLMPNTTFFSHTWMISARLYGDCKNGRRIIYQFELTVLDTNDLALGLSPTTVHYWFYMNQEIDAWINDSLPVDMSTLIGNDPRFYLNSSSAAIETNDIAIFNNKSIFWRGNQSTAIFPSITNNPTAMTYGEFIILTFGDASISVMECDSRTDHPAVELHQESAKCSLVLDHFVPPGGPVKLIDSFVMKHTDTERFLIVMYQDVLNDVRIACLLFEEGVPHYAPKVFTLDTAQEEDIIIENTFMFYSRNGLVTVIAVCSDNDSKKNQSFFVAFVPVGNFSVPADTSTLYLRYLDQMEHDGETRMVQNVGEAAYALTQVIDETRTVVTWLKIVHGDDPYRVRIEIEDTYILDRRLFSVQRIVGYRLILLDKTIGRVVFRMRHSYRIKSLDTNVRPIYEGVLPVPGLDTNGDSIKDLVDIDVIQGIFIMGLNRSETDTANITKQFIDIYVVDMRGNDDDPIGRLRLKMTVEVPPYNGPLLVLQYLDPVTLRIHALICFEQGNIHVVGELHGSKATLKILPSKLGNGITERNMRYSGSACNESDSLLVPLKIVAAEWDDVIVAHATSNPYDLENNETSILEIESHLINIASHRAGYDVIAPESFKGTFEVIPMIVPDKRVSSLILPQPFQFKAEDKIFVHDDAHLLIRGKNSVTIFKIDSGRPPILLFNKTYSQNVLTAYMTYDPKMNYKVRGSGPLEFVFVLLKGDYDKNDVDMNVYDSTNFTSTAYYTDKDVGYCDCIRFEVIKRNQEIFSFSVHCRTKRGSGTTWTLSMVDLIPTNTDDKSITGTILGGFKPGDPYNGKPFQMKYKPLDGSGYGMMRPTSSSTLSYYFFDNMGQVGLMYFGNNKEVFGYHTFSTTCVLRQDTSISCRIFEQDMDLGCIVLCDQVRIESFKVRIRVDELDTENNEALTGVKVIKEEGYKIPINHKVLHLQKGETFDFVVTETSDKNQSVLMYDTATGLILYRMNASEICPKENPGCKLDSLYIHQFGDNRILLLPEGGQLDNSMFIWQKPQLNFSRDQLRKSGSLKEFKLVINSVTTKETNKMISILDLFKPKQEDFFWVYLAFVIVLAIFLVLCFLLLLYMNWRAEERAQVRKEDKEREKNSGLDRVNRMSKQDYKEVPSEKENNRTSLLPQPSVAADTNRTSLYKKKTIKL